VEYERSGTLHVSLSASDVGALDTIARALDDAGAPHVRIDGAEVRRFEPALSERAHAALLIPEHGYVTPRTLTEALAAAALRRGAMFSRAHVEHIGGGGSGGDTGARVRTADGEIHGDAVIVASGSWSSALTAPALRPEPVKPIRGQLLQLRVPERVLSRVTWGARCYLVPWRDGSVLVGATVEDVGFDETVTAGGVASLLDAGIELLPVLKTATFEAARAGLRPATADEAPAIGPSSTMPRVFYATGHYRNGVLLAPVTAQLIADLVLDQRERSELSLTRPARLGL
jgi:glycine oxidase